MQQNTETADIVKFSDGPKSLSQESQFLSLLRLDRVNMPTSK